MDRLGHGAFADLLDEYADAAEQVARADLAYVDRQMAHVDASAKLYGMNGPHRRGTS
ncbi:hypothetical protein [Streptomyces sp. NPDC005890]|uniref:hypothetical protein n=1 Tax=Streptomyces sp. NPDC005890 TaxID=3154568 RepID=UPI00340C2BF2